MKTVDGQKQRSLDSADETIDKVSGRTPIFTLEWSRTQVLARAGFKGPGQSKTFKFGEGQAYRSVADAKKAAVAWTSEQLSMRDRGVRPIIA